MLAIRNYLLSATVLLSLISPLKALAEPYQSWVGEFDPEKHCSVYEVHNQQQASGFDNHATVNETTTTSSEHHTNQVNGSNTGWGTQSVDLVRQRDCSAVMQMEAQRYAVYQQQQTIIQVNDTNIRQGFIGNLVAW